MTYLTKTGAALIIAIGFGAIASNATLLDASPMPVKIDIQQQRFDNYKAGKIASVTPKLKPLRYDMQDRICLYKTVYGEARNQSNEGQMALASNILNRVEDKRFPNTICGVVNHQRVKGHYQFDAWNPKGANLAKMNKAYDGSEIDRHAMKVMLNCLRAMRGNRNLPKDSFNFHPTGIEMGWTKNLKKYAEIGDHVFYVGF